MKNFSVLAGLSSLALVLSLSACTKQLETIWTSRNIGCIVGVPATRSNSETGGIPGTFVSQRVIKGGGALEIVESCYVNEQLPYGPQTRGAQITTDGAGGSISIAEDGFVMTAYAEDKWHHSDLEDHDAGVYFGPSDVTSDGSGWSISGEPKWLNGVPITFWCWDKYTDGIISSSVSYTAGESPRGALTFGYSLPSPSASPFNDAGNQHDMVISCNSESRAFKGDGDIDSGHSSGSRTDEKIDIHFYHALSAVQFFTGNVPAGYRIASLALKNVASSTTISVTGTTPLSFGYTNSGTSSYRQDYSDGDSSLDPDLRTGAKKNRPGDTKTFFMIPQTLGDDAELELTIVSTSDPADVTVNTFSLKGSVWEAGMYYVYRINAAGEVSVTIEEQCTTAVKQNVRFRNTNNVSEYFRAMIVANWYDNDGNIVAPWTSSQGTFRGLPGSGWSLQGDGFYYYSDPVAVGDASANLFTSYTKPSTLPSGVPSGSHLEMTILVQAVASKDGVACTAAFQ